MFSALLIIKGDNAHARLLENELLIECFTLCTSYIHIYIYLAEYDAAPARSDRHAVEAKLQHAPIFEDSVENHLVLHTEQPRDRPSGEEGVAMEAASGWHIFVYLYTRVLCIQ